MRGKPNYLDGVMAVTYALIQDRCSFIKKATQTPPRGSKLPLRDEVLSSRLRPEAVVSLAIFYLAYSSLFLIKPSPSVLASFRPLLSSNPIPTQSSDANPNSALAPPFLVNDEDVFIPGAAHHIPFGAYLSREQTIQTRKFSFLGSWDDALVEPDVTNINSSRQPNPTTKSKEPRHTPGVLRVQYRKFVFISKCIYYGTLREMRLQLFSTHHSSP